ncbi:hypothetical protein ACHWQZ_G016065 [Mnemiopsis leidyi]
MRFLVLLSLTAVVSSDFCNKDRERILEIRSIVSTAATVIFGESCPELSNGVQILFSGKCSTLSKQALCYGFRMEDKYGDQTAPVSYRQLAEDIDGLTEMGNLACKHGEKCFNQISAAVDRCIAANPNFVTESLKAAELAYQTRYKAEALKLVRESNAEPLFKELADLVMKRFNSVADIEEAINEFFSNEERTQISSDAEEAGNDFIEVAKGFCNERCFDESALYFKPLLNAMHEEGSCTDASEFCGSCQENADSYLSASTSIAMPCCLKNVAEKTIEAYDLVEERYEDLVERIDGVISDTLSAAAKERVDEIVAEVRTQAGCIGEVYDAHKPDCSESA